ncbi:acyltransferase family protein [Nocardiopsis changdeensis]|uniref:Acyltransferase n=1 Tax=Nocardiopsis changdeensis TaxID=2831969 RepID=A0ABX8BYY4_9ACTN|nr:MULTISPECIES: acyltransferase [Nocardiopsis]QUX25553.1 acyltransferase [Nocardiopsis changdeensis]QYX35939.1 acyltransferase [Nocardiopsis sp. MT53]
MSQHAPPSTAAGPGGGPRTRLHYIDNLRVALTILVVLHHAALTYSNIPVWFYLEPVGDASAGLLDLFIVLNQTYFMGLFFLLAGYFTPGSADRRGVRGFVRERLVRLGVPFLLFVLLVRPLLMIPPYQDAVAQGLAGDMPFWLFAIVAYDPGPMWFVEVLLVFGLAYALVRRLRRDRGRAPEPRPADDARLRWLWPVVGFTLALAVVSFLWRWVNPAPYYWPVLGLPSPNYLPQYVSLFVVGILAFRGNWATRLPGAAGWYGAGTALTALVAFFAAQGALGGAEAAAGTPQALALMVLETFLSVGTILALLVFFRRFVAGGGPLSRFLSANAFAVYVLHPLVLVAGGVLLAGWEAPAAVKFLALSALAVPGCWALAAAVRAVPGVKRIL